MINVQNIHSLTDFRHNAKQYVDEVQSTRAPLVLTVNGEAAVVVADARTWQEAQDEKALLLQQLDLLKVELLQATLLNAEKSVSPRTFDEIIADARSSFVGDQKDDN